MGEIKRGMTDLDEFDVQRAEAVRLNKLALDAIGSIKIRSTSRSVRTRTRS